MAIRDLGYRPYDGALGPTSDTTWVMLRHGLKRAWTRVAVKLGVLFSIAPFLVVAAITAAMTLAMHQAPNTSRMAFDLLRAEMWSSALIITTAAGASAISDDLAHRAHVFYFSKPILPWQYGLGRTLAVSGFVAVALLVPSVLLCLLATAIGPAEKLWENVGTMLPVVLFSLLASLTLGIASVSVSAWSKSRAMTTTAWISLFLVPHVLSTVVDAVAAFPYVKLLSLTALLTTVGEGLFQIESSDDSRMRLHWYEALPVLLTAVSVLGFTAYKRLTRAEVL